MKTLTTIMTALIAALLVLSPALASAAGGTIALTAGGPYTGSQTITVTGTTSPVAPTGSAAAVIFLNPSGSAVYATNAAVAPDGTFSASIAGCGSSAWTTGTYTVTASIPGYTEGTTTFAYSGCTSSGSTSGLYLQLFSDGSNVVQPGSTAYVSVYALWSDGTPASGVTFTGMVVAPDGSTSAAPAATASSVAGSYWWSWALPSSAALGPWQVILTGTGTSSGSSSTVTTVTSFTVADVATGSALAALQTSVNSLASSVSTMSTSLSNTLSTSLSAISAKVATLPTNATMAGLVSSVASLSQTVGNINGIVSGLQSSLATVQTGVTQLQTSVGGISTSISSMSGQVTAAQQAAAQASTDAKNAQNSVNTVSTYVLVVAVIAAITLVLELAILVRKLS
jgi:hypothetical protein